MLNAQFTSNYLRVSEIPSYDSPLILQISYALFYSTSNFNAYYVGFVDNYSNFSRLGFLFDLDDTNACYSRNIDFADD